MSKLLDEMTELAAGFSSPDKPGFMETIVLLSSTRCGADEALIAKALGYDDEFVRTVGSRLRTAGIWRDKGIDGKHYRAWQDEEGGGVAFGMDACVAAGDMVVVGEKDGEVFYGLSPAGTARVERMLSTSGQG